MTKRLPGLSCLMPLAGLGAIPAPDDLRARAEELFREESDRLNRRTSRLFAVLLALQWVTAAGLAAWVAPHAWGEAAGPHVWAAVLLGGLAAGPAAWLALARPDWRATRYAVAAAQMVLGAVLIHLTAGRIETHFHVFGSLAFLTFYRDWRVLVLAAAVAGLDHAVRGALWPESVFGVAAGGGWRWLEHVGWIGFEVPFLVVAVRQVARESLASAHRRAGLERAHLAVERSVRERTAELTRRTDELRVSEERYRQLFEANPHPMWVYDEGTLRFLAVNAAAVRHYGYTRDEFLGMTVADVCPPDDQAAYRLAWDAEAAPRTFRHRLRSGEVRQVEVTSHPIAFGRTPARLVLALDVTERMMLEENLKQAQKLESIGQLAAGVAHEINTPIQYIGDNTNFLGEAFRDLNRVLDEYRSAAADLARRADAVRAAEEVELDYLVREIPRAIEQTLDGVGHVAGIVRAMKEFAHPGSDEKAPLDLNHTIQNVITVARNEWKYVADVATDLDPDLPPVPGLPRELNQVFLNLLVNAAHAIQAAGKGKGAITISTHRTRNRVVARVADTGCGIPVAIRGRVFDPFFTTKPVGQGTGQGLAIAHSVVVQRHGGKISFESEVGKGTTFVVELPLQSGRLTDSDVIMAAAAFRVAPPPPEPEGVPS